ncbi:ATPase [Sphingosinicella microcystinivorans]|uniref:F0F1 ATP synthase subunit B family protein n=1 Tax=Sphingosinicella microcystinivorans TaxID=335406 RepID=UPI0022F39C7B|nr:ATPase [Sphingosinicella microcystinivorans]WBX83619.1 ATPase [Sphingosinicella microcystinivorans]
MPQFDPSTALPQIAWLILVFGVLFLMMRGLLPRVEKVTEVRAKTIGDDLGAAEAAKLEAERVDAAYQADLAKARSSASSVVNDAKAAAARDTEARLAVVNAEAEQSLAAAEARIGDARVAAMAKLDAVAADAAADIVERLTGKRPEAADVDAALAAVAQG